MLNSTHHCFMKIPNKRELQQIACDHLSDNDFKGFINLYHIFLVIHATVRSDNPSLFRKNLLETNHDNC